MARAEQIKALIRSHSEGDDTRFYAIAMQVAAQAARSGHGNLAQELGHIFGVDLTPHNRWAGAKALRETWLAHIDASRYRPVLFVDEAQEMQPAVLSELRLLASSRSGVRAR